MDEKAIATICKLKMNKTWSGKHFGADKKAAQQQTVSEDMCPRVCPLTTAQLHKQDNKALNMHSSPSPLPLPLLLPLLLLSPLLPMPHCSICWPTQWDEGSKIQKYKTANAVVGSWLLPVGWWVVAGGWWLVGAVGAAGGRTWWRRWRNKDDGHRKTKLRKVAATYVRPNQALLLTSARRSEFTTPCKVGVVRVDGAVGGAVVVVVVRFQGAVGLRPPGIRHTLRHLPQIMFYALP